MIDPCQNASGGNHEDDPVKTLQVVTVLAHTARQYGRYGYRKVATLLRQAGWSGQRWARRTDLAAAMG
jgi:hypothetical protein